MIVFCKDNYRLEQLNLKVILILFISLMFDRDSGHKTFLEDAFENEARMMPGGNWGPASSPWTNVVCIYLWNLLACNCHICVECSVAFLPFVKLEISQIRSLQVIINVILIASFFAGFSLRENCINLAQAVLDMLREACWERFDFKFICNMPPRNKHVGSPQEKRRYYFVLSIS